jgi:hypothetical protein
MVRKIEITLLILDDDHDEDDIVKIIDEAFNVEQVGYWILKDSKETEISEEEAEEIAGY